MKNKFKKKAFQVSKEEVAEKYYNSAEKMLIDEYCESVIEDPKMELEKLLIEAISNKIDKELNSK